ncbi:hypothetical protein [Mycolicibacterium confluentis]|uniref:Uncharacterized protein n=1 Tax=Mycolicibacterium confluentis TaxID=28047 RepID=A0A7I7Y5D0_9MYCO|nr:hypothetical protein [Mycolicibacterium confluentis]MCV7319272.1 hypothetical protein [Mycolicibacterium confluentis]ORV33539.1 hypothetical protein AWB99_08030 [Mycolicibacterium confluentis]BBZ36887.1 hypothetical protein MCNF_54920 [Mycolicibacterium confluentis]
MSWLLAASVPGLLMMATFGLERLETTIDDRDTDDEVAELIERVAALPRPAPVRLRPPPTPVAFAEEPDLPTRLCRTLEGNPQFRQTRQANRV